jgi:2-phosphoglycolate phosphatase
MIRAVLFDLDGTLADTAPDLGHALNLLLQRHGREPLPQDAIRPFVSAGARGLLKLGFDIDPVDAEYSIMRQEYLELYEHHLGKETSLFPGIPELLNALEGRRVTWGIVTNKPERFTIPLLKQFALFDRAACVVSGDTVARAKPFPDPLLDAAKKIALTPLQIIYVGDDERDVQAARAAEMSCLIAAYGYLGENRDLETWGAQAIIQWPLEVLDFL